MGGEGGEKQTRWGGGGGREEVWMLCRERCSRKHKLPILSSLSSPPGWAASTLRLGRPRISKKNNNNK